MLLPPPPPLNGYVVKPGRVEHGTAKQGMSEHQIRNSKTWNTKSGTPNPERLKPETPNPER